MQWSRCGECGGVNDHEAERCYLCGSDDLLAECRECRAPLRTPVDRSCPECGRAYTGKRREDSGMTVRVSTADRGKNGKGSGK